MEKYENDSVHIFSEKFAPFEHLSKVIPGYYLVVRYGENIFHSSYGGFMALRRGISQKILGIDYMDFIVQMENKPELMIKKPFSEMLWFSDCEGSFDSVIANKLFDDFYKYDELAKDLFDSVRYKMYSDYMKVLNEACIMDGVVFYH